MTENLISQANTASNNEEYSLAIESLNFALDINPERKSELSSIMDDLYSKLSTEESMRIKENFCFKTMILSLRS